MYAQLYDRIVSRYEPRMGATRQALLAGLPDTEIAELGPASGANLSYVPTGSRWIGIEPNSFFHDGLLTKARQMNLEAEVLEGRGEQLPLPANSVDAVVCTLVLCSVTHPEQVLQEVRRVLRPGGRLFLMEHVIAPDSGWLRLLQRLLSPLWGALADGCRLDQDTGSLIEAAGFAKLDLKSLRIPSAAAPAVFRHHLVGQAFL